MLVVVVDSTISGWSRATRVLCHPMSTEAPSTLGPAEYPLQAPLSRVQFPPETSLSSRISQRGPDHPLVKLLRLPIKPAYLQLGLPQLGLP